MIHLRQFIVVVSLLTAIVLFSSASYAAEKFSVHYDKSIDLTNVPSSVVIDGYTVKADMSRPAKPFRNLVFKLKIYSGDEPVKITEGEMQFNMAMDMGLFRAPLQPSGDGYTATVKLPKCIFGGTRWYGKLNFKTAGTSHQKIYIFDMKD